jgi:hypothetical protein
MVKPIVQIGFIQFDAFRSILAMPFLDYVQCVNLSRLSSFAYNLAEKKLLYLQRVCTFSVALLVGLITAAPTFG